MIGDYLGRKKLKTFA